MYIYTSYFANLQKLPSDVVPISIARYNPKWYQGATYAELAPPAWLLQQYKRDGDFNSFGLLFIDEVLCALSPDRVIDELSVLSQGRDVALLCWEKEQSVCHRSLVAEWLSTFPDISVEEWRLR